MNKYVVYLLVFAAAVGSWGGAYGAEAEVRVGFVNTARVLEKAPQAEAARAKLQQEFAPRDADLVARQKKAKAMEERLKRDGAVMSEEERRKLEREILGEQRELKRARDEFSEDLNIRRNEEFAKLQREVAEAIVAIAKDAGYDLILEAGVVYASKRVDITDDVIAGLLKRYKQQPKGKK